MDDAWTEYRREYMRLYHRVWRAARRDHLRAYWKQYRKIRAARRKSA